MRYHNFRAFQKHLIAAAPDHLCRSYLIMMPDDYERGIAIHTVLAQFSKHSRIFLNGEKVLCREISEALFYPSLFGGDPILVLDEAEKCAKQQLQDLSELVNRPGFFGYFLCGARSKLPIAISSFEKAGVILDLTEEKPWEKEKRLMEQMTERAQNGGKRLASDVIPLLFERLGSDAALLDREIDKLICFVGTRPTIERSDVFRVASFGRTHTLWQVSEEIIWEDQYSSLDETISFHSLIAALRNQLQLGLNLAELAVSNTPPEEWGSYLPRLRPKILEKRSAQVLERGTLFFKTGLALLFEIELFSRTGVGRDKTLLDFFRVSLRHAR